MSRHEVLIRETHAKMLEMFDPVSDKIAFGREEYWHSFADDFAAGQRFRGDCDDFMLTACDTLKARGLAAADLWLCVVLTEAGEGHAVLIAEGWLVDNRQHTIWPSASVSYFWVKAMQASKPGLWMDCIDHRPPA